MMGEIFKRQAVSEDLRFSGERLTGEAKGQIEIEHLHRYFIARHYCRGRDALDIASGEGYGSAYLAQVAKSVVGVEIDPISVEHAKKSYDYPNLRFQIGDARRIDLPNASVDVVVSFETLAHFFEQEAFLKEVRRVLRCDGMLIISTPDQNIYSPTSSSADPFHVRELTKDQFVSILQQNFSWVSLCLQRPLIGSVVVPETSIQKESPALFLRSVALHILKAMREWRGRSTCSPLLRLPLNLYQSLALTLKTTQLIFGEYEPVSYSRN